MKNLTLLLLIIFLAPSCQKQSVENPLIGTWSRCLDDGRYAEFRISHNLTVFLTSEFEHIALIDSEIKNDTLINRKGINSSLLFENDTLVLTYQSANKIILKSKWNYTLELNRIEDNIGKIDSLNLEDWEKETFREFKKRAEIKNCPDLRTDEEKIIHDLGNADYQEEVLEDIPIEIKKDSIK